MTDTPATAGTEDRESDATFVERMRPYIDWGPDFADEAGNWSSPDKPPNASDVRRALLIVRAHVRRVAIAANLSGVHHHPDNVPSPHLDALVEAAQGTMYRHSLLEILISELYEFARPITAHSIGLSDECFSRGARSILDKLASHVARRAIAVPPADAPGLSAAYLDRIVREYDAMEGDPTPDEMRAIFAMAVRIWPAETDAHACVEAHNAAGWRNIASAPRDGTEVDLWGRRFDFNKLPSRFAHCHFHEGNWLMWNSFSVDDEPSWIKIDPTHWMPIPAPPVSP